jgi:hypothetical protein
MRKVTCTIAVVTALSVFSQAQALPLGPTLTPLVENKDSGVVEVYYYHHRYYPYRYHGHYYSHRYYRYGRYRYY